MRRPKRRPTIELTLTPKRVTAWLNLLLLRHAGGKLELLDTNASMVYSAERVFVSLAFESNILKSRWHRFGHTFLA